MVQKYESGEVAPSIEVLNKIGTERGIFIFNFTDQEAQTESINKTPQSYYSEQYINTLGYEIIKDSEDGYSIIKSKDGEYEI